MVCADNRNWWFCGFYELARQQDMICSWELTRTLLGNRDQVTLIGGDFNEILDMSKKEGVLIGL